MNIEYFFTLKILGTMAEGKDKSRVCPIPGAQKEQDTVIGQLRKCKEIRCEPMVSRKDTR